MSGSYLMLRGRVQVIDKVWRIEESPNAERSFPYPHLQSLLSRVAQKRAKQLRIRVLRQLYL